MPAANKTRTILIIDTKLSVITSKNIYPPALDILCECANTFFDNYLNPAVHPMAYQTRTPDADPGYHTGLSLIDAGKIIKNKF